MKKSNLPSDEYNNNNNNMKKHPPAQQGPQKDQQEEEEDDRKPPARASWATDSETDAPTDQSIGSNASSSTVACTPVAGFPCSPTAKGSDLTLHLAPIEEAHSSQSSQISHFQRQAVFLGGTSLLSIFAFISIVIPASALAALAVFVASTALLIYQTYQFSLQQYGGIINGRGIGDFLPSWLFSMLVENSIHEQLTDDSTGNEWGHMALYFFPGLTREQIDSYVDRLAPRHRDFLRRPGVGHLFGNQFMQLLLGRERFPEIPEAQEIQMQNPAPLPPPMNIQARRLELMDDDDYSAGSELLSNNNNGQPQQPSRALVTSQHQPQQREKSSAIPREAIISTQSTPDESDAEDEFNLLMEAFSTGMTSFVFGPVLSIFSHFVSEVTAVAITPTVSTALVTGSVGAFGFWRGLWGNHRQTPSSNRDVWATVVLGGGVAGVLFMARRANRRTARRPSTSSSKKRN